MTCPGWVSRSIGILDSDRSLRGTYLAGLKVVGSPDQLSRIASQYRIETLLIPTPAVSPREVRSLVSACNQIGVKVQIVPGIDASGERCRDSSSAGCGYS